MPTHRDTCLSQAMLSSERAMVYSLSALNTHSFRSSQPKAHERYCIAASQSQGFQWNQDLFVNQFQQVYSVEFDEMSDYDEEDGELGGRHRSSRFSRRRSQNCISLSHESKTGLCPSTTVEEIEVDLDTPENAHFRSLAGKK